MGRVQALSEYMRATHYVCLGDMIALKLKSTPLLGPMLTSAAEKAGGGSKAATEVEAVAFLKIFELSAHQEPLAHKADVRPACSSMHVGHALLCTGSHGQGRRAPRLPPLVLSLHLTILHS